MDKAELLRKLESNVNIVSEQLKIIKEWNKKTLYAIIIIELGMIHTGRKQ